MFELLARFRETGSIECVDSTEREVLAQILAVLEKRLEEPFSEDYSKSHETARKQVLGGA